MAKLFFPRLAYHAESLQEQTKEGLNHIWASARKTTTKWPLCPAKTQISLGICKWWMLSFLTPAHGRVPGHPPVWSESFLSASCMRAWGNLGSLAAHWVHSEESDQPGHPSKDWLDWADAQPRLIWVFAGRAGHFVGFVVRRLILFVHWKHKEPEVFILK